MGGSERVDDYDELVRALEKANIDAVGLQWYLDLRKYGSVPHAGFGIGFDRLVQFITGQPNIKDVTPTYRTPGSIRY